jgi:hypothetical protein
LSAYFGSLLNFIGILLGQRNILQVSWQFYG